MSDYQIIIILSRHNISFEYILKGQTVPSHMPKGKWPAPLAFFATPKDVIVGHEAARAAKSGTDNAFDNYFELIRTAATYTRGRATEPIRKIFLEGAEGVFEDFFQSVVFGRKGKLLDNRDKMPLYIVCEADVKDEERIHIQTLFTEAGYKHVKASYMNDSLAALAKESFDADYMLTVWADGFDLALDLFDARTGRIIAGKLVLKLGSDPRIEQLYHDVWGQIFSNNPYLDAEKEKPQLMDVVTEFMNSTKFDETQTVVLSDQQPYYLLLQRPQLRDSDESKLLRREIAEILSANNASRGNTALALRGIAATNEFFHGNMGDGWRVVNRTNIDLRNDALRLLLDGAPTPPPPPGNDEQKLAELQKKWGIVSAEASGLSRAKKFEEAIHMLSAFKEEIPSGATFAALLKEVDEAIAIAKKAKQENGPARPTGDTSIVDSPVDDPKLLNDWKRKKKVLVAQADGKGRAKRYAEAITLCQDFLPTIPAGATFDFIRDEVSAKIAEYQQLIDAQQPPKPVKPVAQPPKPAPQPPKPVKPVAQPPKPAPQPPKPVKPVAQPPKPAPQPPQRPVRVTTSTVSKQTKEPATPQPPQRPVRVITGGISRQTKEPEPPKPPVRTAPQPPKPTALVGDGYRLIKEGKLRDAREWFKERKQSDVVAKLSKLIRDQVSISQYRSKDLPKLKAKPDKARVAAILNDVVTYIAVAKELGFIDTDATSLLNELKKLK